MRYFRRHGRARTHKTHFPAKDIDQLRQLVETCSSQKMPDKGNNARIISDLENRAVGLIQTLQFAPLFVGISMSNQQKSAIQICGPEIGNYDGFMKNWGILRRG
jgi:hypothetical protein